jgi:hypothetical protein
VSSASRRAITPKTMVPSCQHGSCLTRQTDGQTYRRTKTISCTRGSRVRFPARAGNFSLHYRIQNDSGAQPPIQWVPGDLSLGVKRPGREADHSPPSSAEVEE